MRLVAELGRSSRSRRRSDRQVTEAGLTRFRRLCGDVTTQIRRALRAVTARLSVLRPAGRRVFLNAVDGSCPLAWYLEHCSPEGGDLGDERGSRAQPLHPGEGVG